MIFHLKEKLLNLVQDGVLNKISTEIKTESKQNSKETSIQGELIITRGLKLPNSRSEITIKDRFPIDITVANQKKIVEKAEVCLTIQNFNVSFDKECLEFSMDFVLTNVAEEVGQLV